VIGTTITHYKILEKLGEGGMGEVWKAQDTRLDRDVALKFLPEKTAEDSATTERFLREARAASALNHPGICTIHDIGDHEGRRYIVMEFVEGRTLGELAKESPLDMETIVETGIQLADALDAAHGKNIIHRDIKSTNIILSPRGQAKILDFGLAKIVQPKGRAQEKPASDTDRTIQGDKDLTDAGQAVGTVSYMSPEQALGKDVDGRTDVFSLGVVLYEMATGMRPFKGDTPISTVSSILKEKPASVTELRENLPRHLILVHERQRLLLIRSDQHDPVGFDIESRPRLVSAIQHQQIEMLVVQFAACGIERSVAGLEREADVQPLALLRGHRSKDDRADCQSITSRFHHVFVPGLRR